MTVVIGEFHKRALQYIRNATGDLFGAVRIEWFDDDHEPIGSDLRGDLLREGMIEEMRDQLDGHCIMLTDKGREELARR